MPASETKLARGGHTGSGYFLGNRFVMLKGWLLVYWKFMVMFLMSLAITVLSLRYSFEGQQGLVTLWVFERGLSFVNILAFLSCWCQIIPLCGQEGISPASLTLNEKLHHFQIRLDPVNSKFEKVKQILMLIRIYPTVFWISCSNRFLHGVCGTGVVCSLILMFNARWPLSMLWWIVAFLYMSLIRVTYPFLGLQMHANIVEINFLIAFSSPFREYFPGLLILLQRWLIFRIMLGCFFCKWYGSPMWRKLTAMNVHYFTQPLPNPISWYMHHMPNWFHQFSVIMTLLIEGPIAFFGFGPFWTRYPVFVFYTGLLMMINMSGNYGFLGVLTIVESISVLDDWIWPRWVHSLAWIEPKEVVMPWFGTQLAVWTYAMAYIFLSLVPLAYTTHGIIAVPRAIDEIHGRIDRFKLINRYAKFGSMHDFRWEFVVEGSDDGLHWKPYINKYKPCDPASAPVAWPGHLPGLDWRIWFLPIRYKRSRFQVYIPEWYANFIDGLLVNNKACLDLIEENPFPTEPPLYIRTAIYDFKFTLPGSENAKKGLWWESKFIGTYGSVVTSSGSGSGSDNAYGVVSSGSSSGSDSDEGESNSGSDSDEDSGSDSKSNSVSSGEESHPKVD